MNRNSRNAMDVSVAICTYDRADLLDSTLATIRTIQVPRGLSWELLVVCNNCTAETDATIARHAGDLPLRRLFESRQGHSNARNCAVEAARGTLLIWTDDDVLVDTNWLSEYVKAADAHPEAAFFGGTVEPWFAEPPPAWLKRNWPSFSGAYAVRLDARGTHPVVTPDDLDIVGANMAMRLEALGDLRFSTDLGRFPGQMLSGEEVGLLGAMLQRGQRGLWVSTATVRHHIPASRVSLNYLWDYYYGQGQSSVRIAYGSNGASRSFDAGRLSRKYRKQTLKRWIHAARRGETWARAFRGSAKTRGILDELRKTRPPGS